MIPSKPVLIGAGILVAVLLVGGVYASQRAQINSLRQEISRTVEVIEERDKERALREGEFTRTLQTTVATFTETIKAIRTVGGGTVVIRDTTRPVTPSPRPGTTTPPPSPQIGTPLIPAPKVEEARTAASERIRVGMDPGHLIDCAAPSGPPDEVELIRDQTGRLLSPNPCVSRINDEVRLKEPPAQSQARARGPWKATVAYSSIGLGYGVSYQALKVPFIPLTLDAVGFVSPYLMVGPGLSYSVNDRFTVGAAAAGGANWITFNYRP